MPVYNLGAYIDDALKSLDKQTFRDFTLNIVDDASTDKSTVEKLKEIHKKGLYSVTFGKKNLGLGALAKKYLPKLDAEYLIIFSADDIMEPTYLEETVKYLDNNSGVAAVSSYLSQFGERTGIIAPSPDSVELPAMLIENSFIGTALTRRSSLESTGWIDSHRDHEDYLQWLSALSIGQRLHLIQKPLLNYRIRSNSKSNSFTRSSNRGFDKLLVDKFPQLYSTHAEYVIKQKIDRIDTVETAYEKLEGDIENLNGTISSLRKHIVAIEDELDAIKSTLVYKVLRRLKRVVRK